MKKKHIIIIVVILVSTFVILGLYQTFALSGDITTADDIYSVLATEDTIVKVPANGNKTVYYKITNANNGTVKYGVGYSGSNIVVKYYFDTQDAANGTIDYGSNKFVKLYIENTGSSESTVTLSTILGYENGGDLIVPSGVTLVTEEYKLYTISYNLNGVSGTSPDTQTKLSGKSIVLPSLSGNKFSGWSTNADANVATYLGGSTFTMDVDVTFYAVWSGTTTGRGNEFGVTVESNYSGSYKNIGGGLVDTGNDIIFSILEEPSSISGNIYSSASCDLLGDGGNTEVSDMTMTTSSKKYGTLTERIFTVQTSGYSIDNYNDVSCAIVYKKA